MLRMVFHQEESYYFQSYGRTPLHNASIIDHLEIVKYLIEKGADVNAKDDISIRKIILYSKLWTYSSSLCF